jgi:hypothetical protein
VQRDHSNAILCLFWTGLQVIHILRPTATALIPGNPGSGKHLDLPEIDPVFSGN